MFDFMDLSMGKVAGKSKVINIWISPNPTKLRPILRGDGGVVVGGICI